MSVELITFFWDIAIIIIAAAIISFVLKLLKQPSLFAYILAGIAIGPIVLGSVAPQFGITTITPQIMLLSELGVAFMLFSVGIETAVDKMFKLGKPIFLATIFQVSVIIIASVLFTVPFGLLGLEQALFLGAVVAFSSTMIVIKILSDKKQLNTLSGRIMISILLIQDFLVIILLPMLTNIGALGNSNALLLVLMQIILIGGIAIILAKYIFPHVFRRAANDAEMLFLAAIATAFTFIGLSYALGLPPAIGAFIGGLALSALPYNLEIIAKIRALRDFFVTIFFVTLGLQLSFSFGNLPLALIVIVVGLIFVIKPITLFVSTLLAGYGSRLSSEVAINLSQVSEFGFIIAGIGLITATSTGTAITRELFSLLITLIAISMVVTPYLANSSSKISQMVYDFARKIVPRNANKNYFNRNIKKFEELPSKRELNNHIVIFGGGTIGSGLAKTLQKNYQTIVVDNDPEVVSAGQKDKLNYTYGTTENTELFERIDLKDAKLVVIAIPNHKEGLKIIEETKKVNKQVPIFAAAHYFYETQQYYRAEVDFVFMPYVAGANVILENISKFMETGKLFKIQNFQTEYMRYLEDKVEEEKRYRPSLSEK